ncbi:MAG: DegT/DnrJ/EryC1/StrS family aminotransferase [Candidatus Omnitrophica bacterium]|nr:DegT/DnrJ/EryC1/StrS family aminotransferase [Candidatus Omnitrophota bacterium]
MNVPFVDFSQQYEIIKNQIMPGLESVFRKSNFILGEEEKEFEKQFAEYCQADYGVGVNSGTDALYLALSALDVTVGDEVIIPAFTFIATSLCISYTGAKPVLVDIEPDTYNIDPNKLEAAITKNTKAIIPVHLYGQPANMDEINAIAKKHHIKVIEDAAQSHGAEYKNKRVGSLGDIACFSFYPTKGLGGFGDGGMVVTNDKNIYEKVCMLRDYGRQGRYEHKIKGYNSRLDTVQAVVLSAKLQYLDEWNDMRRKHAAEYEAALKGIDGLTTPSVRTDRTHVYQTYAVMIKDDEKSDELRRDILCRQLKDEKGIGVLIHYPIPIHLQEAYADLGHKRGDFPISEKISDQELSLPMYPHMTMDHIKYVAGSVKELMHG